jgi:hypothetical protein
MADILNSTLIVSYLFSMSWVAVITSLSSCHRFVDGTTVIKIWSIVQSYVIFAFALVILIKAQTFGNNPECNGNAVVVLFRPFSALHAGRIVGWVVTMAVIVLYTGVTTIEYWMKCREQVQLWIIRRRVRISDAEAEPNLPVLESVEKETTPVAENSALGSTGHGIEACCF